jgi:hypothetical protein
MAITKAIKEMETLRQELVEIDQKRAEVLCRFQTAAALVVRELAQSLFVEHPDLDSFGWTQFTSYYNDGEETFFEANTEYPEVNGVTEADYEEWGFTTRDDPDALIGGMTQTRYLELRDQVNGFLRQYSDAELLDMFGDHKTVTINRSGATVTNYTEHQ